MNKDLDIKVDIEIIKKTYLKRGYTLTLKRIINKWLAKDKDNFYALAEEYFTTDMVKNMSKETVEGYVKDAISSKDENKIYLCAKAIGKVYPELLDGLVDAIQKYGDANAISCFATIVKGISESQFIELAQALVDKEDAEAIVEFSTYVCGTETCFNSFYILYTFIKMVKERNNTELIDTIINNIDLRQKRTEGMPRYAIPYDYGVCTEMLKFKDALNTIYTYNQTINSEEYKK